MQQEKGGLGLYDLARARPCRRRADPSVLRLSSGGLVGLNGPGLVGLSGADVRVGLRCAAGTTLWLRREAPTRYGR